MKKTVLVLMLIFCLSLPVFAGLQGKVIGINAGHGGGESGAVGLNGLVERDINLKVAFYLRDMLKEAGAIVVMTREGNYDLDGTQSYSGTRDRYNRLRVGRINEVDIFLFLHFNASVNREANQIEVYYMPKYHGPSKSLAEYVNEGLKSTMNLNGIATTMSQVVINHATLPTIIGEASYLSNPKMEEWFRNDENLKKIAEGYFIGVQKFFEDGMPKVNVITPDVYQKVIQAKPLIVAKIIADGNSPIDPATVQVRIDNKVIAHEFDEKTGVITAQPKEPLVNGAHKLLIIGRNKAGISAIPLDFTFYVDKKPASLILDKYPTIVPGSKETIVKISGRVLDKDGQPVMDGNQVYFEVENEGFADEPWVFTRDGYFVNFIRVKDVSQIEIAGIRITAGSAMEEIVVDFRAKDGYLYGNVKDVVKGQLLKEIQIVLKGEKGEYQVKSDRDGVYFFNQVKPGKYKLIVEQVGYETYSTDINIVEKSTVSTNLQIKPIDGGVLMNRKIVLNTAVEGTIIGAESIVTMLKARLERAGAVVQVVTVGENDEATVKETNKFLGQFLVSLKVVNGTSGKVYHYPRNQKAQAMAKLVAVKGLELTIEESKSKLITSANCQSLIVEIPQAIQTQVIVDGLYQFFVEYYKGVK